MSARISLRGMRRLIWVDTLRRCHNVGFLAGRLIYCTKVSIRSMLSSEDFSNGEIITLPHCNQYKIFYFLFIFLHTEIMLGKVSDL